jgi:hypothetical protein
MTKIVILTVVAALVFTGYGCGNSASLEESYDDGIGWIDRTPYKHTGIPAALRNTEPL